MATAVTLLIETLWNVKYLYLADRWKPRSVLIETLWNVKSFMMNSIRTSVGVLIETLWNVKSTRTVVSVRMDQCINRNIVECKEYFCFCVCGSCCGINRNIVECKEPLKLIFDALILVLIETLWNVKSFIYVYIAYFTDEY